MARAPVGKKSQKSASRSSTTTASRAKGAKKTGAEPLASWSEADQDAAAAQGWGLFEIIDERVPTKIFFEMQAHGPRFSNDGLARVFVAAQSKNGDALALKALRLVFQTKSAIPPKRKK